MKKIIFIRPAPYSDRLLGKDLIVGFDLIGSQKYDPKVYVEDEITKERVNYLLKKFNPTKIYSSPAMRCVETVKFFNSTFEISPLLNEVKFSLKGTVSAKLLKGDNTNVNRLRKELINAFVENKIEENPKETLSRMKSFFEKLQNIDGNTICISHAFIIKFYEIFFRNNGTIKNPSLFLTEHNWEIKPYEFMDGFCVSIADTGKVQKVGPKY